MINYLQSVRREFSNIRWLRVRSAFLFTVLVLAVSVAIGFLVQVLDGSIIFIIDGLLSYVSA